MVVLLNKALGSKAYFGTKLYFLNGEILLDSLFYYMSLYRAPPAPNDQNKLWSLGFRGRVRLNNAMSSNYWVIFINSLTRNMKPNSRVPTVFPSAWFWI